MKRLLAIFILATAITSGAQTWRNPADRMEFVWIPGGTLNGAGNGTNPWRIQGFWMGKTEVTVGQFRRFVKATGYRTEAELAGSTNSWRHPGFKQSSKHPAVYLSSRDSMSYAKWAGVDIPTESEWLFACQGGGTHAYYFGDTIRDEHVWHRDNSPYGTHRVATKKPGPWGLFDLVGSAYEYCRPETAPGQIVPDAAHPRGGSWTRCPDRIINDLPKVPSGGESYPVLLWDDDRGFRCVCRQNAKAPAPPDGLSAPMHP